MGETKRAKRGGRCGLAVALALAACAHPSVSVRSDPAGARLHRDGHPQAGRTPVEFPAPYYGKILLELEKDAPAPRQPQSRSVGLVAVEPPISSWLFPLDFPLELAFWLFGEHDRVVQPKLEAPEVRPLGEARIQALIDAAKRAATSR